MSLTHGISRTVLAALLCTRVCVAAAPDLVPFVMPWNDSSAGPTDLSGLSTHPAGSLGRLTVDANGHFSDGGERIRFWGVNFAAVPAFPLQTDADAIAARLAKFGVNIVRFHHLDATWYPDALIDYVNNQSQTIDSVQLDKLERLVSALSDHGIYTNFNIQTARIFQKNDGLAGDVSLLAGDLDAHKLISIIDPRATQLQQQYAKAVLTHENPYRHKAWKDDPAVAIVEILNEQGLLHSWLGGKLDSLPDPWHGLLTESWDAWLLDRYGSTAAVSNTWNMRNVPLGPELLKNVDFAQGANTYWRLEVAGTAKATASIVANADGTNSALCVDTTQPSDQSWHVQINQPGLVVDAGQAYTVSIRIRAQGFTSTTFGLRQSVSPWGALPGGGTISLNTNWQDRTFSFMADSAEPYVRYDLSGFGGKLGQVCFTAPSVRVGGNFALDPSQTLESGTVPLVNRTGAVGFTVGATNDFIEFLRERELKYFTEMRDFLRQEVGFGGFVGGTIVGTSTPTIQARMDIVDSHAYWQHPQFPGTPWDPVNWTINNSTMVDSPPGTLSVLGAEDVMGIPHTVSEYNHPAPNTYSSEAPLLIASYGALQDWDGIYFFDYGSDTNGDGLPDWDTRYITGFTPIDQHPPKLVNFVQAALLFRKALLAPAADQAIVAMTESSERDAIRRIGHAWGPVNALDVGMPQEAVYRRMRLALQPGAVSSGVPTASDIAAWGSYWTSDTSELRWSMPGGNQNYVVIDAPLVKAVIGHVPSDGLELHGIKFTPGETRQNWCTLSAVATQGDFQGGSAHWVVAATGDVENTGQQWKDASKSSVGNQWGRAPSLVEPVSASLEVPIDAARVAAWALDGNGQRGESLAVSGDATHATIQLGLPATTLWYEIVISDLTPQLDAGQETTDSGAPPNPSVNPDPHAAGGGCNCRMSTHRANSVALATSVLAALVLLRRSQKRNAGHNHSPQVFSLELKHGHPPQLLSLEPKHSHPPQLFSLEFKYVTQSIPSRYPPKDGGIWGVEVPPSGRDLGWEKNNPLQGLGRTKFPIGGQ
jgi:hypothetical protein